MAKRLLLTLFLVVLLGSIIAFNSCACNTTATSTTPASRWSWGVVDKDKPATVINTSTGLPIKDVSAEEAYAIINVTLFIDNLVIIDVRSPAEFAEWHIQNAINIDVNAEDVTDKFEALKKNLTYIVYCKTGIRSDIARDILEELGFPFIINMTGGINAWVASGLPVVK